MAIFYSKQLVDQRVHFSPSPSAEIHLPWITEALVPRAAALRGLPAGIRDAHREMLARLRGRQFLHPARGVAMRGIVGGDVKGDVKPNHRSGAGINGCTPQMRLGYERKA